MDVTDLLDILTGDEAKRLVGIADNNGDQDDELGIYITAVSRRLDELCGPVVNRTLTAEAYNGGCASVRLRHAPVSSFTTVTEYNQTTAQVLTAETNSVKTANNYLYDDELLRLYRRVNGTNGYFPSGRRNVTVTYVGGRAATTTDVDGRFKRAAGIILTHLWRVDRGGGSDVFGDYPTGFAVPARALDVLGNEVRAPVVA